MIFWFSGTGNSRYAAETIANELGETTVSLNSVLKNGGEAQYTSETPFVFVTPTYAWRIPRVVEAFIQRTTFSGCKDAYFVMTCGDSIGNAGAYLQKLCNQKGLRFCGVQKVPMPENYIAMFHAPTLSEAGRILEKAKPVLLKAAENIRKKTPFDAPRITLLDRIYSTPVNPVFYKACVSDKKFYATDGCIACGKCAEVCPLQNITLKNGKPVWAGNCTHCMACISYCPKEAIEYGKKSIGQVRYTVEKALKNNTPDK